MTVDDTRKDIEVDHVRGEVVPVQEVIVAIKKVSGGTGREARTEKTESWTRARDRKAIDKKLCKKSSSGSGRRRETLMKVQGSFATSGYFEKNCGKLLGGFLEKSSAKYY
jgi:hypothetical protein